MNKRTTFLILSLFFIFHQGVGQTYKMQFNDLLAKHDTVAMQRLLQNWESSDSNDAELFVAYFNYYLNISRKENITLGQNPKGEYAFAIMDQDTTKKEPVGYMYGDTYYDRDTLSKAFYWIDKGIIKYPDRLDMRFGKIYLLGQIEDYETFTNEIIKTVDYSSLNKNKWAWEDNQPVEDPKNFMLSSIQDYQVQLYNTGNDSLLNNMKRIAEAILKYYPDHIESLSNLSVVYMIQSQYDKALELLLKAHELNPKDYIVLNNIAQAYRLKGDDKNAIKYYQLTIEYGDERAKEQAQKRIEELKKK
ncbi:MAG TPA: tetratricopeptide repeat protein [Bacteroidota bacterium]|nr:tetratricopeptide repeat protein [Bacteroidota bacterium]